MQDDVTLQPQDYVVAMAECGCAQACRRERYRRCKGIRRGMRLLITCDDPSTVIQCPLCCSRTVSQKTKDTVAAVKNHIDTWQKHDWLVIVELLLEVHSGKDRGTKRADVVLVPRHAVSMRSVVVIEIDPDLHFNNPCRRGVRPRRGVSAVDAARDMVAAADEAKDALYMELGVHAVMRITGDACNEMKELLPVWQQELDAVMQSAIACK